MCRTSYELRARKRGTTTPLRQRSAGGASPEPRHGVRCCSLFSSTQQQKKEASPFAAFSGAPRAVGQASSRCRPPPTTATTGRATRSPGALSVCSRVRSLRSRASLTFGLCRTRAEKERLDAEMKILGEFGLRCVRQSTLREPCAGCLRCLRLPPVSRSLSRSALSQTERSVRSVHAARGRGGAGVACWAQP